MNPTIEITLDTAALAAAEKRLFAAIENPKEAFDEIGSYLISQIILRFKNSTDPHGNTWQPSAAATERGGKTLVHRGHLRNSYVYQHFADGVIIGSNMVYAAIHHFGGLAGRKSKRIELPARPALGTNAADEQEIVNIMNDHIAEAWAS